MLDFHFTEFSDVRHSPGPTPVSIPGCDRLPSGLS